MKRILYHPFFIKLFHWEYWPFHVVYVPIYFYWLFLCLKARSFFFFNASNPTFRNGGFLMESKKEIYDLIPPGFYPATLFFKTSVDSKDVLAAIEKNNLKFPLIGKPDIGMKGLMVKKLENENDLLAYIQKSKVDFLIQSFIPHEKEAGIFYYRFPDEEKGKLSGIVAKEFLSVIGNGTSTVEELMKKNKRYILQLPVLKKSEADKLNIILKKGEELVLVPYGNHIRGSKFTDASYLIDEELTKTIDNICKKIDGFYFGRLDIRFNTWAELKEGKSFSIVEVNGAGSEPTHIYDPGHSLLFAWKEIIRHLYILFRISKQNHFAKKIPYMSFKSGLKMLKENRQNIALLKSD